VCVLKLWVDSNTQSCLTMVIKVMGFTLWLCCMLYHQSKLTAHKVSWNFFTFKCQRVLLNWCSKGVHCNKHDILHFLQFLHAVFLGGWIRFCHKVFGRKVLYSVDSLEGYWSTDMVHRRFLAYSWWWNRFSIKIFVCEKMQGDGQWSKYPIYLK
jgi:hypothetical protein